MTLAWRVDGDAAAPPLVLLNSVGTSTEMWTPCLPALAERYRVIRIDAPGHGASPPAAAGELRDLGDLAGPVLAVLDELGVRRADVAGISLGGMTAMWLAAHHPDRVGRLAVLCTSAHLGEPDFWAERAAAVRAEGMAGRADAIVARWVTPGFATREASVVEPLRTTLLEVDAESYAQCCEILGALDLRADLPRIAAPTLAVGGAEDTAIPPAHSAAIASAVPRATLLVLPQAAHIATVEQPVAVAAALLTHFAAGDALAAGFATRRAVLGDDYVDEAIAATSSFSAPFQDFITRYAWGEVWSQPALSRRERSLVTLAALVTVGAEAELALHVRGALRNGLSADEIAEVLRHTAIYAGVPRANRAVAIARAVIEKT